MRLQTVELANRASMWNTGFECLACHEYAGIAFWYLVIDCSRWIKIKCPQSEFERGPNIIWRTDRVACDFICSPSSFPSELSFKKVISWSKPVNVRNQGVTLKQGVSNIWLAGQISPTNPLSHDFAESAALNVSTWCHNIISASETNSILGPNKSALVQPLRSPISYPHFPKMSLSKQP